GVRPTVSGSGARTIETHIFDFDELIYGLDLSLRFIAKIRDERRFESLDALKGQLTDDEAICRALLSK
ncbi:MAG: riboflavin kinase, partial [Bacteroidales bacterium]|nr:riboflavin kinase [Bacteroidales bacterium]